MKQQQKIYDNFLGYASALDLDWLETVALETLGFKLVLELTGRALRRRVSNVFVSKLVRKSSPAARQLFATRLQDQYDSSAQIRDRVKTVGIAREVTTGDPVNNRDILLMTVKFLNQLRTYVLRVCLIKSFLLHNICARVKAAHELVSAGPRFPRHNSRCILHNLDRGLQRLKEEVFLLRYN